jgi:RHS repeat-associated protein
VRHATYEVVDAWTGAGRVGFSTVTRSYYDPLGQLRVTDKRSPPAPQTLHVAGVPYWYLGAYEEYRYDALGRRVLKRSRRENCNEAFCPSHIERYVWDGSSILTEIRYPGANGLPFDSLERDTGYVYTVSTTQPPFPPPTQWDTLYSPHYGRVSYLHGTALDKPIAVRRYRYGRGPQFNQSWEDLTAYPHYNWRGLASGDKKALSLDPTTTDIEWAAKDARAYGQIPISTNAPKSWFGSLIVEQRDASGLHYKRARYYDPVTGRFTQEDPIGLAGGLNLYGYANGDPVNFSDPFGLASCATADMGSTCDDPRTSQPQQPTASPFGEPALAPYQKRREIHYGAMVVAKDTDPAEKYSIQVGIAGKPGVKTTLQLELRQTKPATFGRTEFIYSGRVMIEGQLYYAQANLYKVGRVTYGFIDAERP